MYLPFTKVTRVVLYCYCMVRKRRNFPLEYLPGRQMGLKFINCLEINFGFGMKFIDIPD